jgi:hypothetical protein
MTDVDRQSLENSQMTSLGLKGSRKGGVEREEV